MKTKILSLILIIIASCSKQDDPIKLDPYAKLPPETQTGANTFGCLINDQVFYPRDGTSYLFQPGGRGMISWGDPSGNREYNEFEIRNLKDGKPCSRMIIYLQNVDQNKVGEYSWKSSNFQNGIDGLMQNYVFAEIFDTASNSWKLFGSFENSGKVTLTKYENNNIIISGNFYGKLKIFNGTEEITISNGRFDINNPNLPNTLFP